MNKLVSKFKEFFKQRLIVIDEFSDRYWNEYCRLLVLYWKCLQANLKSPLIYLALIYLLSQAESNFAKAFVFYIVILGGTTLRVVYVTCTEEDYLKRKEIRDGRKIRS